MPVVMVPKVLQEKLGDDGTQALIDLLDAREKASNSNLLEGIDARMSQRLIDARADLQKQISDVKVDLQKQIADLKVELQKQVGDLKTDLVREIASSRAETIKWMFVFWAGQAVVLAGLLWTSMR